MPPDPEFVHERICLLGLDPWLPPVLRVELAVLGVYSHYTYINDEHVLQLAERILQISLLSDGPDTRLIYDAAEWAWGQVEQLVQGNRVTSTTGPTAEIQADHVKAWFSHVMRITDGLIAQRAVDATDLGVLVSDQIAEHMRSLWGFAAFGDPYALGYHLYFELGLPGTVFGSSHGSNKVVEVAYNLAWAVREITLKLAVLEDDVEDDDEHLVHHLNLLLFYFPQLKGYLTAAADASQADPAMGLLGLLTVDDDSWAIWNYIRHSLERGDAYMRKHAQVIQTLGWTLTRTSESTRIAGIPMRALLMTLDGQLSLARAAHERLS